jgi:hypothetical protein
MKFGQAFQYLKSAFSDNGSPSSSRLMTIPHSLVAMFCAVYMTLKTGGHPDGTSLVALGGFATVHYAVNRVSTAWGKDNASKPDVPVPTKIDMTKV